MQQQFLFFALVGIAVLFAVDLYVFRHWQRFAGIRPRLRWTLPVYRVALAVMPFVMPVYAYFSDWWAVEPRLARWGVVALWLVYYVPRFVVAAVLVVVGTAMKARTLFIWFRRRLLYEAPRTVGEEPDVRPLDLTDMKTMSRQQFLQTMGWSAATLPFVVVGYSVFRSLYDFDVRRVTVTVPDLPPALDGLTIAQMSDLHAGSMFSDKPMQDAVDVALAQKPDLITITGDFVNSQARELPAITGALEKLRAPLGVYASLGNHDHYANVAEVGRGVRETGIDLLVNAHRSLAIDGAKLHVVGTDNTGFRQHFADLDGALRGVPEKGEDDSFRLLLAHDPTFWDQPGGPRDKHIDLMLAGHTHGGQIGVEWGPLRWSLARVAYPRWAGLYSEKGANGTQHLYVNRGIGTVGPPLRLGIRPEITLVTLVRG